MKVFVVAVIQMMALVNLTSAGGMEDAQAALSKLGGAGANLGEVGGDFMKAAMSGDTEAMMAQAKGMAGKMMMAMMDKNGDGKITAEEWTASKREEGSLSSQMPWEMISGVADSDCDEKINTKELNSFIALSADGESINKEAVGDDETWNTLLANHDGNKDGKISTAEYMAFKSLPENQKCAGCSLTAAVSMLGLVFVANILF